MQFVLYAILAYILYNFIFRLVIPVYLTTRKIKKGFRAMQEQTSRFAQDTRQQQPGYTPQPNPSSSQPSSKPKADDYIDFEEVK